MSITASDPTASIPVERLPDLRKRIDKLNKVAEKLSLPLITIREGQTHSIANVNDEPGIFNEVVEVFVEGEAPRLNGWEFIATLEHDENGTLIRRIPTFAPEVDLSQYRTATPDNCDHCGYRRRRNDTYIVVNETGATKQVGSSCLKDFTGHESPQQIAKFLEQVRDLIEEVRGGGYSEGRLISRYSLDELMADAAMTVRQNGYVSRRQATEERPPTAETVKIQFFDRLARRTYRGEPLYDEPLGSDYEKAAKIIDWVRSLSEEELDNDYLYNLFTVCKSGTLTDRQFGIAASAVTAYDRVHRDRAERDERQQGPTRVDEFLGEPGSRLDVEFTVRQVFHDDTDYGVRHKHIMMTDSGHRLVWKTTTFELEPNKRYRGNFSVREHYEGKYGKETQVFRPRKGDPQEVTQ